MNIAYIGGVILFAFTCGWVAKSLEEDNRI